MIYLAILVTFPLLLWTPWWTVALLGTFLGFAFAKEKMICAKVAFGSGICAIAVALIRDAMSEGQIVKRFTALFGFSHHYMLYLTVAALTFVTAYLAAHVGQAFKGYSSGESRTRAPRASSRA